MNSEGFLKILEENDTVSGDFDFTKEPKDTMMDRDFINKSFVDCNIVGGDFASGIFRDCTFNNCVFSDLSMVGVNFDNCHFVKCKFERMECSFSMGNCRIDKLVIQSKGDNKWSGWRKV
ncbi:pentapeptide repeat-containing protein [Candidatus Gracilibacteria bacterium]|nr:pentapeptide repeat-containing protein [Candidatus Gracilibacteria bacterium]